MISASSRKRARLTRSSACLSRICLSATSRCSSSSMRHEDGAQAALGVGAEDAEPQPVGGRGADRVAGGVVGVAIGTRPDMEQRLLDLGVADGGERCAGGRCCGDGGEAPLGAAAVLFQVPGHQRLDDGPVVGVEMAHGDEVLGQRPALVERPGLEGPDEPGLVDQAVLQGEQSEEEIAIDIGGGHDTVSRTSSGCPRAPGLRRRRPPLGPSNASVSLSHLGSSDAAASRRSDHRAPAALGALPADTTDQWDYDGGKSSSASRSLPTSTYS